MKLEKRIPSGREKDQAAIELLERLREQLYSPNITIVRKSAFNLSWLQEDGLDILKEALFMDDSPHKTKCAAAYGLRKMRGRMKRMARQVLLEGTQSTNPEIAEVCLNALKVWDQKKTPAPPRPKAKRRKKQKRPRFEIRDIPQKGPAANRSKRSGRPANHK